MASRLLALRGAGAPLPCSEHAGCGRTSSSRVISGHLGSSRQASMQATPPHLRWLREEWALKASPRSADSLHATRLGMRSKRRVRGGLSRRLVAPTPCLHISPPDLALSSRREEDPALVGGAPCPPQACRPSLASRRRGPAPLLCCGGGRAAGRPPPDSSVAPRPACFSFCLKARRPTRT